MGAAGSKDGGREGVSHAGVMIVGAGGREEREGQSSLGRFGREGEIPWNGAIKWAKTDEGWKQNLKSCCGVVFNVAACLSGQSERWTE